jgi:hypothetical protein
MEKEKYEIVFEATYDWCECRKNDYQVTDDYDQEALEFVASQIDGFEINSGEAGAYAIDEVDNALLKYIQPGDIVVGDSIGGDVYFVRKVTK